MTWVLIIIVTWGHTGVAVDHVEGFTSLQSCVRAGHEVEASYSGTATWSCSQKTLPHWPAEAPPLRPVSHPSGEGGLGDG